MDMGTRGQRLPPSPTPTRGSGGSLTQAQEGEEVEPEEAQDGRGQGLVHSREVDPLLQLGREVDEVEVVPIHHMLEQDVDQACREGAVSWTPGWAARAPLPASYLCPELGLGLPCDRRDQKVDRTRKCLPWLLVFSGPLPRPFLPLPSPFQPSFWLQGVSVDPRPRNPEILRSLWGKRLLYTQKPGLSLRVGPSPAEHPQKH